MALVHLNEVIEYRLKQLKEDRKVFQKAFICKEFTLDERWETFLLATPFLEIHSYISRPMDILTDCLYDDFYTERYQTKLYGDIDERICDNRTPEGEEPDEYSEKYDEFYAKRDEWREAVLTEGYAGFINDW